MFVKPREGLVVRDPGHKRPLDAAGSNVPDTSYWRRRVRDGDIVKATPATDEKPSAASESAPPHTPIEAQE